MKLIRISIYALRFVRKSLEKASLVDKVAPVLQSFPASSDTPLKAAEIRHAKIIWSFLVQKATYASAN